MDRNQILLLQLLGFAALLTFGELSIFFKSIVLKFNAGLFMDKSKLRCACV